MNTLSRFLLLALCALAALAAPAKGLGELTTLTVGPYQSDANSTLTGPYQAMPLPLTQTYRNTSPVLQDSLAFTVQCFGPGYSQGLTTFFGPSKPVGPSGQDAYALGDIELPGPGSYLVQTAVYVYDRTARNWVSGPTHTYWLFPTLPAPLPVTLVSFTATATDSVTLQWQTASEESCFGFWVERSPDGLNFSPRSFTPSQGSFARGTLHRYQVRDVALPGRTYYRLRQVDVGSSGQHYSPVVSVAPARVAATVYPNPAQGQATVPGAAGLAAKLYDSTGRLNRQQLLDTSEVLDLRGLVPGTYLLVVGEKRTRLVSY